MVRDTVKLPGKCRWPGWRNRQTCLRWQHTRPCSTADSRRPAAPPASPGTCLPWETNVEEHQLFTSFNELPLHRFTSVIFSPHLYALKSYSITIINLNVYLFTLPKNRSVNRKCLWTGRQAT